MRWLAAPVVAVVAEVDVPVDEVSATEVGAAEKVGVGDVVDDGTVEVVLDATASGTV